MSITSKELEKVEDAFKSPISVYKFMGLMGWSFSKAYTYLRVSEEMGELRKITTSNRKTLYVKKRLI